LRPKIIKATKDKERGMRKISKQKRRNEMPSRKKERKK
jgi:hypothetical protein